MLPEECCAECSQQKICNAFSDAECPYLTEALESANSQDLKNILKEYQQNYLKYKHLCDAVPDAIFLADAETGTILEANEKAAELLGIPVDEIIGMHQTQLHPPEEAQKYGDIFRKHLQTKKDIPIEKDVYVCRKDGQKIPVQITASVIQFGDKQVVCGIFRDARKTKQLLENLATSQQRLKRLAEAAFEAITIHEQGRIIECNQQYLNIFGYTLDEARTISIFQLIAPESRDFVMEKVASKFEGTYEAFGIKKDGTIFPVEIQAKEAIMDGVSVRIAAIRDLTEQVQQKEQITAVFESSMDCIIVLDRNYNHLYINKAALEAVNITPDNVTGKTIFDTLGHLPEMMHLWKGRIDEVFKTGKALRVQDEGLIGDRYSFSDAILSPVRYPGGEIFAVSIVVRDVTEQRLLQQRLAEDELRYRELYDNAQVALFRTALDGTLLNCNKACLGFFGYSPDEKADNYLNKVCVTDYYVNKESRQVFIDTLLKNKRIKGFEAEFKRADGTICWASFSAEVYPQAGYIEGAIYDITAGKVLSRTERKVLDIIMQGKSNKQIAKILGRSVRTIEDHRAKIMQKLGAKNLVELTQKSLNLLQSTL